MKNKLLALSLVSVLLIAATDPRLSIFNIWDGLREQGVHGMQVVMPDGFNLIICDDEWTCLHETGHVVDQSLGIISATPAFQNAVLDLNTQEFYNSNPRLWERLFWYMPYENAHDGEWAEYYANLYADWKMGLELPESISSCYAANNR